MKMDSAVAYRSEMDYMEKGSCYCPDMTNLSDNEHNQKDVSAGKLISATSNYSCLGIRHEEKLILLLDVNNGNIEDCDDNYNINNYNDLPTGRNVRSTDTGQEVIIRTV